MTPATDPYRLPTDVVPRHYDVELEPDLAAATFDGTVRIAATVAAPTAAIVLNAIELEIATATVDGSTVEWSLDEATERLTLTLADRVGPGDVEITIAFRGILNDKLRGFYRSTFVDTGGTERVIATTQMQSTDCRRAFPCWDEPAFKATFAITLIVDSDLLAVSNGPEIDRRHRPDGKAVVRFADTMAMSTYLVAFVVGPLEATEPVDVDGIPLRVVHVPGKGDLTAFGLEVGAFALRWFQEYYGIAYPGEKVDLLALPDFAAGAMENLGCITFRENLLLADTEQATHHELQTLADVVSHELAHMWFGDLVTMRWWNGIWLNEAFATFMEVAACDAFRPEWHRWTTFGLERSMAFETDALSSTRPVEYEVRSPADCEGMFDVLTYQKGGALLRMLEQYLGADRFRAGVGHYLRQHAYGNTETSDLWDAIESVTNDAAGSEPVRKMMDSWIWQPGYPLVTAAVDGDDLVLSQQRFGFGPSGAVADGSEHWLVPVHLMSAGAGTTVLLDGDSIRVPLADASGPVIVNAGGHGFYRVDYSDELRARLTPDVLATLDTLERYNLVDDAWNAVVAGRLGAPEFVDFVDGFAAERDHAVWQAILIGLRGLGRLLDDADFAAYQARVAALVAPVVTDLGDPADGEDDLTARLRGLLVAALAVLGGDPATIDRMRAVYAAGGDRTGGERLDPELVAAATTIVAATGGADDYDRLLAGYRTGATPQDQLRHLFALAEFDAEDLVLRTCELCLSDEVKTQNAPFVLRACIANRRHGAAAWRFVRDHWDAANAAFPTNTIVRMVRSVDQLTTADLVDDVQSFFADHPIPQAAKTLDQILERQRVNAALRQRESARLAASL